MAYTPKLTYKGKPLVRKDNELLDGAPKCPNCGEPLDFEVTEE